MTSDGPLFAFSLFTPTIINEVCLYPHFTDPENLTLQSWASCHYFYLTSNCSIIFIYAGYEATAANLLSVPVYAWACLMTCVVGFLGDRLGSRGYINLCASQLYPLDIELTNALSNRTLFGTGKQLLLNFHRLNLIIRVRPDWIHNSNCF